MVPAPFARVLLELNLTAVAGGAPIPPRADCARHPDPGAAQALEALHHRRQARAWLTSDDTGGLSFLACCRALGLDPRNVRAEVRAVALEQREGLMSDVLKGTTHQTRVAELARVFARDHGTVCKAAAMLGFRCRGRTPGQHAQLCARLGLPRLNGHEARPPKAPTRDLRLFSTPQLLRELQQRLRRLEPEQEPAGELAAAG